MRAVAALVFLILMLAARHGAAQALEAPDLLFEVRLGGQLLSDATPAWQQGADVYLPLGELARLLTIAIRTAPGGQASGYILAEERGFHLDAGAASVTAGGQRQRLAAGDLLVKSDDIYVATRLLARWLPVDLAIDMSTLTVNVTAREALPVQARLERQSKGQPRGPAARRLDPGFARVHTPYRMFDAPVIDQTLSLDLRPGASTASYSAYAAADLLGMEAALYVGRATHAGAQGGPAARLTLGRHDPDGSLLGPLRARSALIGSVAAPGIAHIAPGNAGGTGFILSNRALAQSELLDRHSLRGDLPPGWDVELYYNEALLAFQQSRTDGKYSFEDLPLNYGPNDFRLVFHGPLGQLRVERHSYLLEHSPLAPGQLVYHLASQRSREGGRRHVAMLDWGIGKRTSASAAVISLEHGERSQRYASLAMNAWWQGLTASATLVKAAGGGHLGEIAFKTRVLQTALGLSRTVATRFASDYYPAGPNPLRVRDELRIDGALAGVQLALQARREQLAGGQAQRDTRLRLSTYRFGTAVSNALRWQSGPGGLVADGALQASRRVAGIGLSGQAIYQLRPQRALAALALAADTRLRPGIVLNAGVSRTFVDPHYRFSAGLNKSLGRFGLGVGTFYTSRGDYGATISLFTAMWREPRRALWAADAAPMAASGAASVLVFLDRNRNGAMDGADEAVGGAGFALNGGAHMARTGSDGIAWLPRLAANQYLDLEVDAGTLEDPQWQPRAKGMRIVPRAGKISQLTIAIGITGEIDGTTFLLDQAGKRAIGSVELELVDQHGGVAARASSSSDGYYVIAGVVPGTYRLRVAPAQLARLGLRAAEQNVVVADDGAFVNGRDVLVAPLP